MDWTALLRGGTTGAMLIVAIGAQNAFVLAQGLRRAHVLLIVLTCALSDALLITVGVSGGAAVLSHHLQLVFAMSWLGAAYLGWFGWSAIRRVFSADATRRLRASGGSSSVRAALLTTLALTFLNPHVYLDSVLVLGLVGAREIGAARILFVAGAVTASFVWFFGLGFGARLLSPLFAKPIAWRVLDALIGVTAWLVALALVRNG